jgi:hypothetical protein
MVKVDAPERDGGGHLVEWPADAWIERAEHGRGGEDRRRVAGRKGVEFRAEQNLSGGRPLAPDEVLRRTYSTRPPP